MKQRYNLFWGRTTPLYLWLILQSGTVAASDFSWNILLGASQVYDSNIFLADDRDTDTAKLADFLTTITPSMEVVYETETSKAVLTARSGINRYAEYSEMDNIDQRYGGAIEYAITELSSVNLNAGYRVDESLDSDLETSGLRLDTTERKQTTVGGGVRQALSEKSMATLSYGFTQEEYVNNDEDSDLNDVSLTLTREVDWLPDGYVYGSGEIMWYQTHASRQNNMSAVLGFGFRLTEGISLNADAGVRNSRETYDEWELEWLPVSPFIRWVEIERTEENWGQVAHLKAAYQGEVTTANLIFSYDVQPASGRGTLTERTQISFDVERRLSDACRVRAFSGSFLNFSDSSNSRYEVDESTMNIGLDLTYDLNRFVTLDGQYLYTFIQDDKDEEEAGRHRFLIRLSLKYPVVE